MYLIFVTLVYVDDARDACKESTKQTNHPFKPYHRKFKYTFSQLGCSKAHVLVHCIFRFTSVTATRFEFNWLEQIEIAFASRLKQSSKPITLQRSLCDLACFHLQTYKYTSS